MPRLDRLWYEIDAETKGFDEGILKSQEKLKAFTEYAAGNPIAVLGALGVAATLAAVKLANMAAEFEKQMAMVNTVLEPTQASLKDLTQGVLNLNAALPIASVQELTKGLYDIISSGIDAGKSIEFLDVAAKAAIGGVTSVATAVDSLTTAVNAFRNQGLTVERASDVMFQAVNKGKITFEELSHAMGLGAAIAASMGIKFEDLNAAVAQLSLGGMSARMSMIGVRSAIVNILKPTEDFQKTFPKLAAEFNRSKLESVGFIGFLTELQQKARGNSEVFVKLFQDIQGYNAVMALTNDGGKAMNQMLKDVTDSVGTADIAAGKMGATTAATNQILKNQFHNELVSLGQDILPAYNAVLESAVFWMERMGAAGQKLRLRSVVDDLRLLGMSGKGKVEFPNVFGIATTKEGAEQFESITAFIKAVTESKQVLEGFTTDELKQAEAGMKRFGASFPDLTGYDATVKRIDELLAARAKKQAEADAADLKAKQQQTAGAVAFVESNAKSVAELNRNVNALGKGEEAAVRYQIAMQKLKDANVEAQQAVADANKAQKTGDATGAAAAQKAAGDALGKATAARQDARQALKDMDEAKRAVENEKRSDRDRLQNEAKARRELGFELQEALAKTTATTVDDLAIQLAKQVADFRQKVAETPGMTDQDRAAKNTELDAIERANEKTLLLLRQKEAVEFRLRETEQVTSGVATPALRDTLFQAMGSDMDALQDKLKGMNVDSEEFKQTTEDIAKLEQGRGKLMAYFIGLADKTLSAAEKEEAIRAKQLQHFEKMAREVGALAKGAADAAVSFGVMDEAMAGALENVVSIAANLPAAFGGDLSSIGAIIGSMGKLIVGSTGGKDPELEAAQRENTQALLKLTTKIGDLSKAAVSGNDLNTMKTALQAFRDQFRFSSPTGFDETQIANHRDMLDPILAKYGLTYADLEDVAKALGITLHSFGDIYQVINAINLADLAAYTDTFAGSLQKLTDTFTAYGITDPTEKLRRTIQLLSGPKGIPAIGKALQGIDVSTAGGAAAAIEALRGLFDQLAAGTLTAGQLGSASVDETRQAILDLITQLTGSGSAGASTSFGYNSTITEVTGSHIAGLLGSANVYAQRTMLAVEALRDGLRASLPNVFAPSLSAGGPDVEITLNINLPPGLTPSSAASVGALVGRAAVEELDRGLGARFRARVRASGNATVS